jgi:hypothetical protein
MINGENRIIRQRTTPLDAFLLKVICPYLAQKRPSAIKGLGRFWNFELRIDSEPTTATQSLAATPDRPFSALSPGHFGHLTPRG